MAPRALLITGATGKQGGAVIDALLALPSQSANSSFSILAVTRDTASSKAQRLKSKSPNTIKLVQGNLDDCPALFGAARKELAGADTPIWGVFSVQTMMSQAGFGDACEREITQGKALIDEALKAGVSHFVYSGVDRGGDEASPTNETPIPHFQTKCKIEQYLRERTAPSSTSTPSSLPSSPSSPSQAIALTPSKTAMSWTVLRPVAFMDNLVPGMQARVFVAALRNHLGWGGSDARPLQWVATRDIGVFAAKAFADRDAWRGRAVGLAGDELTVEGLDHAFREATGEGVPVGWGILGSALTTFAREFGIMIAWFASDGYKVDIAARRKEHPGMLTMVEWLRTESAFTTK